MIPELTVLSPANVMIVAGVAVLAAVAVGIMAASLWWDLCGRIRKAKREMRG